MSGAKNNVVWALLPESYTSANSGKSAQATGTTILGGVDCPSYGKTTLAALAATITSDDSRKAGCHLVELKLVDELGKSVAVPN